MALPHYSSSFKGLLTRGNNALHEHEGDKHKFVARWIFKHKAQVKEEVERLFRYPGKPENITREKIYDNIKSKLAETSVVRNMMVAYIRNPRVAAANKYWINFYELNREEVDKWFPRTAENAGAVEEKLSSQFSRLKSYYKKRDAQTPAPPSAAAAAPAVAHATTGDGETDESTDASISLGVRLENLEIVDPPRVVDESFYNYDDADPYADDISELTENTFPELPWNFLPYMRNPDHGPDADVVSVKTGMFSIASAETSLFSIASVEPEIPIDAKGWRNAPQADETLAMDELLIRGERLYFNRNDGTIIVADNFDEYGEIVYLGSRVRSRYWMR
jgi:hypothetical protein